MFYNSYGYSGMIPPNDSFQQPQAFPMVMNQNNYMNSQVNDMNERISRLERQVKRLDQRLTRIETPYTKQSFTNEPDNNMYMV